MLRKYYQWPYWVDPSGAVLRYVTYFRFLDDVIFVHTTDPAAALPRQRRCDAVPGPFIQ